MILEVASFGPVDTNAVLIACEKTLSAAVIDLPLGSSEWLTGRLKALGLSLNKILLTHSHWDHIADVSFVKEQTQAPIYVHTADASNVEHPGIDGLPLFFSIQGIKPDHMIQEGETIGLGDLSISVIHTPGHTPGGVCFYIPQENVLISGDTFFRGAIGKVAFPTGSPELMKSSLQRLLLLPESTRVIPGHGGETTLGREKAMLARTISRL